MSLLSYPGLPAVYGLSDEPCFGRSYVLVCEYDYSGQLIWRAGEEKLPITGSDIRYTTSSTTLEIHNTSDVVSEESEVYYCSVEFATGTTVTGSAHDLRPLSECNVGISCRYIPVAQCYCSGC